MGYKTISPTNFSGDCQSKQELSEPDVFIHTSGSLQITAHSSILASASPVLENMIDRSDKDSSSESVIQIPGVPCDAVTAFVDYLYLSRCTNEQMDKYGIHLLALSHVYCVPQLKQMCSKGLAERLAMENVVDVLQLARLCDAPYLYFKCMKLLSNHFKAIEKTEGWAFLQENDTWLELQILHFMDETELRKKRARRQKQEQSLYMQLSEAMECLEHICTEGCTDVGPYDMELTKKKAPCSKFSTCQGLQLVIRHFAMCKRRVNGGCLRCKRMWQLLRLHSSICEQPDSCKVPLCRQFKLRMQEAKPKDDPRWKLLVKKVASAKAMSSLSLLKRKQL
ncbi:BTB/POZ and TAZ domain-containing protein [Quillaja saponaria]|uniref:BTB/POZ and TAZ domain-containing protein n=1 Tax=Quillaja saponaria TaxID=32244 RepID=A0AAD7LE05_QUISA|nr:BTB/POZ and TAZ domain-containing protein [Quillaja saponaria]